MAVEIEVQGITTLTGKHTITTSKEEDKFSQTRSVSRRTLSSEDNRKFRIEQRALRLEESDSKDVLTGLTCRHHLTRT